MIYKLICNEDPTFLYIGHTTNWTKRKSKHKKDTIESKSKVYQKIRELGGWGNIKMIWIEDYPCNNKREGEAREQHWMDTLKSNMNTTRAFVTYEQRLAEHRQRQLENKESVKLYNHNYHQTHQEERLETMRNYQNENRDELNEKKREKTECNCGGRYTHSSKAKHFKTKKHQDWLLTCHNVVQAG
jgi:predicted GIY-YIG superfamily endonuclease